MKWYEMKNTYLYFQNNRNCNKNQYNTVNWKCTQHHDVGLPYLVGYFV